MFPQEKTNVELGTSQVPTPSEPIHLSELWAQKYVQALADNVEPLITRKAIAEHLTGELRSASAKAWNLTESFLSTEVKRHRINNNLIDPWAVSKDVHDVFEKTLAAYAKRISPQRLSVLISSGLGEVRQRYTEEDPRLIGFVSMQFHYCGQTLLQQTPKADQKILMSYFKVIDDHLYMPLQRAYNAAAQYTYNDERLQIIQSLLPHSTTIANRVVDHIHRLYPNYCSYTDRLNSPHVRVSSVRDTEMFQVYLWTCVLEQSPTSIQQELFPLCAMLYPTLNVSWELVRQMLHLLAREFEQYVQTEQTQYYAPYQDALWKMFSPNVFP
ncbi:MAG: hypothetical protein AAGF93_04230 [Cyanobacteria bacterium P01_H01_bin.105]